MENNNSSTYNNNTEAIKENRTSFLFDKIISSVSLDEVPLEKQEPSDDKEKIQKSIALFGRMVANGHVNWPYFPDSYKERFKEGIVQLYNTPPENGAQMLKEMETLLLKSIPDNHTFILNNQNRRVLNSQMAHEIEGTVIDKYTTTNVGKNSVFSLPNESDVETLCLQKNPQGHSMGLFTKQVNGKKLGIISLSKCPQPNDPAFDFNAFLSTLDQHLASFDGVVFDVRGNEGGNAKIIQEISKRLYGKTPSFLKTSHMRTTDEAKIIHQHKFPGLEATLNRMYQSANEQGYVRTAPVQEEAAFNHETGFDKPVYVLADRRTSSSGEYVFALQNHPKVKFLGENSCGCGEYGDTTGIALPAGGMLVTGVFINEMYPDIPEGIGRKPTHPTTPGKDALSHAMAEFKKDSSPYIINPYLNQGGRS